MMNNQGFNAKITGLLFIIAAVSSIIGLKLYDPILANSNFLISAINSDAQIIFGAVCELILIASATGTGIMLFPLLKRYHESMAVGYLGFRILEVVIISIGTVSILTALSISKQYTAGIIINTDDALNLMLTFKSVYKWTFMIGPNFMLAINTFIYSYALLKMSVVPVNLSRLGLFASILIMIAAILELFGVINQISTWGILLAIPIAFYEMTLATWLIFKGIKTFPESAR